MPRIAIKDDDTSFFRFIIKKYLDKNKIDKLKIKLDLEKLKEISKNLKGKCGMTHQEIADEFGVNRIKITRLINSD